MGAVLVACAVAPAAVPAATTTITVNTTADNLPSGSECQGGAGDCSLRQAIDAARKGDTIKFASSLDGKTITLTNGNLTIFETLKIAGPGAKKLTVSGNDASQIFFIYGSATISGLTLTKGNAVSSPYGQGGAIEESGGGSLTLSRDVITHSVDSATNVGDGGGAVEATLAPGFKLKISHTTISNNQALSGAGVLQYGSGQVTITQSKFIHNKGLSANPGSGGALFVQAAAKVTRSTFSGNTAATGGAIYFGGSATSTVGYTTFVGNKATVSTSFNPSGGAIFVQSGQVDIGDSTFTKNSAKSTGGGSGYGGAIFRCCGAPPVALWADTLVDNSVSGSASSGGNVASDNATPTVQALDTIIADGHAQAGKKYQDCGEPEISLGYNLSSSKCGFTATGDRIDTQPKLAGLAHNGGPTETIAEKPTSATVDHGSPKAKCTSTDQRGKPRPNHHESHCDIGAYELQDK